MANPLDTDLILLTDKKGLFPNKLKTLENLV